MTLRNKLFKEMFSTFAIVDPIQPNPPKTEKISTQPDPTQPMGQPNPWTTLKKYAKSVACSRFVKAVCLLKQSNRRYQTSPPIRCCLW